MDKGPSKFDFAASAPRQTYEGPKPANPTPSDLTPGEWDRAKAQQVGGMRKRCQRGKSCSATCIAVNEDCVVELPRPMQREIRRMAIYIIRKSNIQEGSRQDKALGAGIKALSKVTKVTEDPRETSGRQKQKISKARIEQGKTERERERAERKQVSWKDIQGLKARRDLLGNAEFDKQAMALLQRDAFSRGLVLRKDEVEALFDALPSKFQNSLMKTGKAGDKWWAGKDENGNDIFSTSANKQRGVAVLDIWLRQGGTDAYQGRKGKVFTPWDLDVEHVRPLAKGGKDAPSNWILAKAGVQRKRNNTELGKWIDRLPNSEAEQKAVLSKYRKDTAAKKIKDSLLQARDPASLTNQDLAKMNPRDLGKILGNPSMYKTQWLPMDSIPAMGSGRPNSPPPPPFRGALAMITRGKSPEVAKQVASSMREIWNNQLIKNQSITPKQAVAQIRKLAEDQLDQEQLSIFTPALQSWAASNPKYDFL